MSTRPGNPKVSINAATALGVAAGLNFPLDQSAQILLAVSVVYVATAGAGNRVPTIRVLDSAGNIIWSAVFATAVTAAQTSRLMAGAGAPQTAVTTPLQQTYPLPMEFSLPPNASLQVLDAANIAVADTVAVNILTVL